MEGGFIDIVRGRPMLVIVVVGTQESIRQVW